MSFDLMLHYLIMHSIVKTHYRQKKALIVCKVTLHFEYLQPSALSELLIIYIYKQTIPYYCNYCLSNFASFLKKNQTHLNFPGMSLCAFKHEHFLKYWMFYTLWHIRIAIRQWFKGHPHLLDKVTHENLKLLYSLEIWSGFDL